MRQQTIGSFLGVLMTHSAYHRCRVETEETGDVNAPGWETALAAIDLSVQELTPRERVARADDYQPRVTHEGYCADATALSPGARLVETHRLHEDGSWQPVASATAQTWQVLGKSYLPGVPEPHMQVRIDLHRMGPAR